MTLLIASVAILELAVILLALGCWNLSRANRYNIAAIRAQQENLDRLNQAMADHTHLVPHRDR